VGQGNVNRRSAAPAGRAIAPFARRPLVYAARQPPAW